MKYTRVNQMVSQSEKDAKKKLWYRHNIDNIVNRGVDNIGDDFAKPDDVREMEINLNLLNNELNLDDFAYVFSPYGDPDGKNDLAGELPANFTNRDIISSKINAFVGMSQERPFEWTAVAINREAVHRRQEEEMQRYIDWVYGEMILPYQIQQKQQEQAQMLGRELQPNEAALVEERIMNEREAPDPEKIHSYMTREWKDLAEIGSQQILNYVSKKEDLKYVFNKGLWFRAVTAREIYHVSDNGRHPTVTPVFPKRFRWGRKADSEFIHDAEWQLMEYRWTPSEIISEFNRELSRKDIEDIYDTYEVTSGQSDSWFTGNDGIGYVPVYHVVWRGLRKIKYLTFLDEEGEEQETIVPEDYILNREEGDISIEEDWVEQIEEGWRIGEDIYKRMGPVKNQFTDPQQVERNCMPYIGSVDGAHGDKLTSIVSRIKEYQYLYNIVIYRIEKMMASDKGKKVFMNLNYIPIKEGWDTDKFLYFLEANDIGFLDPMAETSGAELTGTDITNAVKEVDMSFMNKIVEYMEFAEYLERKAGDSIGLPKQLEGQIKERESVRNVQQTISASTNILEVYYRRHDKLRKQVLEAVIDKARAMYADSKEVILNYVTDDQVHRWLTIDGELLASSTIGIFINDPEEASRQIRDLRQAAEFALSSQKLNFADYLSVVGTGNISQAEEVMRKAEERERLANERTVILAEEERRKTIALQAESDERKHERDKELINLKEGWRQETELKKAAVVATGFLENKDQDNNRVPDPIEYAQLLLEQRKVEIEEKRVENDREIAEKKLKNEGKSKTEK